MDLSWLQMDTWEVVLIALGIAAFFAIAIIWGIRAHRYKVSAGREELIGKTAEVLTAVDPRGTVFVEGERWTAISEAGRVEPGEEVIIIKVDGLKIWVRKKIRGGK